MKGVEMLVVSLRGVHFRFQSHLGCSEQNTIIFSRESLVQGLHAKKYKNIYCLCYNMVSFQGSKKACATPRSVSFRGLIQNFRRASPALSYAESPSPEDHGHDKVQGASLAFFTSATGKTQGLRAVHLYVVCKQAFQGKKWRNRSRRTIIEWKKGEEENVIDFLSVIFTRCARSDSRTREKDGDAGWETQTIKPLTVATALFDPQQSRPRRADN